MATYVVTGAASGMGAATAARLRSQDHVVLGVDLRAAEGVDLVADLATSEGRTQAVRGIASATDRLDGVATFAGIGGATGRPARLLASLNYFGTVELLTALRPLLAAAGESSAVAISSNSTTVQPGWSEDLVAACLSGDEARAGEVAGLGDSMTAYPATKAAVARWVRRTAPGPDWAGAGIRLNAVAPGLVETTFVDETRADPVLGELVDALPLPLGRGGTADELAELVAFLLGPSARFFCGSVVLCDGGTEALLRPDDWPARWQVGA
jgi:NAD(P)-dependent dehydrogenase (short-subunit alcohol dehydrogenase family)